MSKSETKSRLDEIADAGYRISIAPVPGGGYIAVATSEGPTRKCEHGCSATVALANLVRDFPQSLIDPTQPEPDRPIG